MESEDAQTGHRGIGELNHPMTESLYKFASKFFITSSSLPHELCCVSVIWPIRILSVARRRRENKSWSCDGEPIDRGELLSILWCCRHWPVQCVCDHVLYWPGVPMYWPGTVDTCASTGPSVSATLSANMTTYQCEWVRPTWCDTVNIGETTVQPYSDFNEWRKGKRL